MDKIMKSGIYKIYCLANNKSYIGQAKNFANRWSRHQLALRKNIHPNKSLQSSFNKYGFSSLEFSILEYCFENLDDREQFHLDQIPKNLRFNFGDVASNPFKGQKHSEETRTRLRALALGRTVNSETRSKISIANKGKPKPPRTSLWVNKQRLQNNMPVLATDMISGLSLQFSSLSEAARTGFSLSAIQNTISGRSKSHAGLIWTRLTFGLNNKRHG